MDTLFLIYILRFIYLFIYFYHLFIFSTNLPIVDSLKKKDNSLLTLNFFYIEIGFGHTKIVVSIRWVEFGYPPSYNPIWSLQQLPYNIGRKTFGNRYPINITSDLNVVATFMFFFFLKLMCVSHFLSSSERTIFSNLNIIVSSLCFSQLIQVLLKRSIYCNVFCEVFYKYKQPIPTWIVTTKLQP